MNQLSAPQLDSLANTIKLWAQHFPMVGTLLLMIGLDIVSGVLLAISKRCLNSTTSWAGMVRKAMTLLLVAVAVVLEPLCNGVPLILPVSMGFVLHEVMSILENAAALGMPLPDALVEVMEKINSAKSAKAQQKAAGGSRLAQQTQATVLAMGHDVDALKAAATPTKVEIVNPPDHPVPIVVSNNP